MIEFQRLPEAKDAMDIPWTQLRSLALRSLDESVKTIAEMQVEDFHPRLTNQLDQGRQHSFCVWVNIPPRSFDE